MSKALAAIAATNLSLGCGNSASAAAINCAIGKGATIDAYANRGLGRSAGASSATANRFAFPGENPAFNQVILHNMNGSSTYNALQVQLRGQMPKAGRVLKDWSLVVSYSLSRLESTSNDAALVWLEADNLKSMYGPSTLDRTHIFSAASVFTVPGGVRISPFWRAMSALPQSVFVPSGTEAAGIFKTDFNGDGGVGDALPGTGRGSYGRDIGCGAVALNRLIDRYNTTEAGTLTPAGQALVNAGLFTTAQLASLKAVKPQVLRAPDGQVCLDGFMTADVRISRPIRFRDGRITIEPAVEWFNLFNVANFDLAAQKLNPVLTGTIGSINGTTTANRYNRAGFSGGSMSIGGPRSWQLSLRLTF